MSTRKGRQSRVSGVAGGGRGGKESLIKVAVVVLPGFIFVKQMSPCKFQN
jgi:hypothetical protein